MKFQIFLYELTHQLKKQKTKNTHTHTHTTIKTKIANINVP